jgi:putative ABC transport system permease protein
LFLSWREIKHSKLRYLLIGSIIMLISWLVFLLAGLGSGLSTDNGSAIKNMKSDHIIFQKNALLIMHRSLIPLSAVDEISKISGVKAAAPLGQLTVTVSSLHSDKQIDSTVLATEPGSFLMPSVIEGSTLTRDSAANEIIVDKIFKRYGVKLGDQIKVLHMDQEYKVVGFTTGQTFNHLPVIFMDIPSWQMLKFPTIQSKAGIVKIRLAL